MPSGISRIQMDGAKAAWLGTLFIVGSIPTRSVLFDPPKTS